MIVPPFLAEKPELVDSIELFSKIDGAIHIGFPVSDLAVVQLEVLDQKGLSAWLKLVRE